MARALAIIAMLAVYAAMSAIRDGIRRGAIAFGFLKAWNTNRKAKRDARRAKREGPLPDDRGEFLQPDEDFMSEAQLSFLRGALKWLSGFLALKGIIDVGDVGSLQVVLEGVVSAGIGVYAFWASHQKHKA